ncbi:hypothetical protein C2869_13580 [Saccharobesus litoralis]|uniref:Uncharacterized protein n=1 Tax=Saccharobesus litoralis TaxID=2172099 RepID=A0A2S0VT59_9ALTE|nr:DUF6170 family protein [Saccharobesus litoralis]AWB67406.1 hypothetical protein C2869_13580 [Saccharobesus litoralis]
MALYFSSSQVPALQKYSFSNRIQILAIAISLLSVPQKLLLNIAKLIILTALFFIVAKLQGWTMLLPMVAIVVTYPLVINPMMLFMAQKNLKRAIEKYEHEAAKQAEDESEQNTEK